MTDIGFFSVVQKPGDDLLTVRARSRADLERLRAQYMHDLGEITAGGGTDYPYRATASRVDVAAAMTDIVASVEYANFKSRIAEQMGPARAKTYGKVWSDLLEIEREGE